MTDLLGKSLEIVAQVEMTVNGQSVGYLGDILPGGYVTIDTTAAQIRTCNFTCLDPTGVLTPSASGGYLSPTSTELTISIGFVYEGQTTMWQQGVFSITECDVSDDVGISTGPGPVLTVTGADRSFRISANPFENAFSVPAGTTVEAAITSIVQSQAPWLTALNLYPSGHTIAAQVFQVGDDPWQAILQCAQAAGEVAYFDQNGVLVARPAPALGGAPTAISIVDGAGQIAAGIVKATSSNPGYNGVVVTGTSAAGTTVSGSAFDVDPSSPLYAAGPYGERPAPPIQVSAPLTAQQCQAMAVALLPQVLGLTIDVTATILPAPFVGPYDLAWVQSAKTQLDSIHVVQGAVVPFDYTALEVLTLVPIGAPISQLTALKGASIATYASSSWGGSFTYTPYNGSYTGTSYSGGTGTSTTLGGGGFGFGGGGLLGGGGFGGWWLMWSGGRSWRRRRDGWSSGESDAEAAAGDAGGIITDLEGL